MTISKRNAVVVRASRQSLHWNWLPTSTISTTWDLIVNTFEDDARLSELTDVLVISSQGAKYPALGSLFKDRPDFLDRYDYIWLPDDDLECNYVAIDMLFDECRRFSLQLAQPSLTPDSFVGYPITIHNPHYRLRYTNWVELMAPCFSRDALRTCLHTFGETMSGWGIDYYWPALLLQHSPYSIGVIDNATVRHTRPFGGPGYVPLLQKGVRPIDEMRAFLRKFGIERYLPAIIGAVDKEGRRLSDSEFTSQRNRWFTAPWGIL